MAKTISRTLLALLLASAASTLQAEEWQFTFTPYGWMSDMEVTAGGARGSTTSDIDFFDDLLPIVDAGWMSQFEARNGKWSVMNDTVYMKLSDGVSANKSSALQFLEADVDVDLDAGFKQLIADFAVGYTLDNNNTTFYGGLRYIRLDVEAELDATVTISKRDEFLASHSLAARGSRNEDWVDTLIGVRQRFPLTNTLGATVQTDVGAGHDSVFSSVTTATLDYAVSDSVTLRGGYRYARIDKDDSEFLFDQTAEGWLIAGTIAF